MKMRRAEGLLAALSRGPCVLGEWAERVGASPGEINPSVQWLLVKRSVVVIGTISQVRAAGIEVDPRIRGKSRLYALAGTPMLPGRAELVPVAPDPRPTRRKRTHSGSGVVAGRKLVRGYVF